MSRFYFKYAYGYINVDENNVYFTLTGNWQEAKTLKEKGEHSFGFVKRVFFWVFIIIYLGAVLAVFIFTKESIKLAGFGLIIMLVPIIRMINHRSSDVKFFIPKNKIFEIQVESSIIWLKFYSKDGKACNFYIQKHEVSNEELVDLIKSPNTSLKFV